MNRNTQLCSDFLKFMKSKKTLEDEHELRQNLQSIFFEMWKDIPDEDEEISERYLQYIDVSFGQFFFEKEGYKSISIYFGGHWRSGSEFRSMCKESRKTLHEIFDKITLAHLQDGWIFMFGYKLDKE